MAGPRMRAAGREAHGRRFGTAAEIYDAVRPGYPDVLVAAIAADGGAVLDLGAGTGKLTRPLLDRGLEVIAVDPDGQALARNPARGILGTGESIPLPESSVDLVTVAQAWHWLDPERTTAEIARVLRPGGTLWIVLNQLDVRVDWVLRLSRIMHAGDVYRPHWRPALGPGFGPVEARLDEFTTPVGVNDIVDLASTRSYWLRSPQPIRERVEANLRGYFAEEHPVAPGARLALPYLCLSYRAQRLTDAGSA